MVGTAVGAGVGEVAGEEVVEELVPLGGLEGVVGFDGVAADGLGDDFFAEAAAFARLAALLLEIGDDGADEFSRRRAALTMAGRASTRNACWGRSG
jgi:hypothetical protein